MHRSTAVVLLLAATAISTTGVGYAAGKVGTDGLRNGAVTTPKLKDGAVASRKIADGSIRGVDLVADTKFTYLEAAGGPELGDGQEGDCVWQSVTDGGFAPPGFRLDRFGTAHLTGVVAAVPHDDHGDGMCGGATDAEVAEDGTAFVLPRALWPHYTFSASDNEVIVVGRDGFDYGSGSLPPGSVYVPGDAAFLDGVSWPTDATGVYPPRPPLRQQQSVARDLENLGLFRRER